MIDEEPHEEPLEEPFNAHLVYVKWFAWLFWTTLLPLLFVPIFIIAACISFSFAKLLIKLVVYAFYASGVAVIVTGTFWRFNGMGHACTRDAIPGTLGDTESSIADLELDFMREHGI